MMTMNMHLLVALLATVSVSANNHDFRGEQRELTAESLYDYFTSCPKNVGNESGPRTNMLSVNECTTTAFVSKGIKPAWPLEEDFSGYKDFIENVMYYHADAQNKSIGQYLNEEAKIDSFLVYHGGKLVYENYLWDEQSVSSRHFLYSATKSFVGMVATDMYSQGLLNLDKPVNFYLEKEDLDSKAFSGDDVTVEMVLDMTNQYVHTEGNDGVDVCDFPSFFSYGLTFNESNGTPFEIPPGCEFFGAYEIADGMTQLTDIFVEERANSGVEPFGWPGPTNKRDYIEMLKRGKKPNGDEWYYRTASTDVMAMIINKVLKETDDCVLRDYVCTLREYFGEKILSSVGLDHDVLVTTDNAMSLNWGRGGSATARDMLRLGVMLLNDGKNREGEEVLSRKALDYIFDGSDKSRRNFRNSIQGLFYNQYSTLYDLYNNKCNGNIGDSCGWSYNAYFKSFNPSGKEGGGEIAYMEGFYGQIVWIDREADLVIAMMSEDALPIYWGSPFHALTKAFRAKKATNHSKKSAKKKDKKETKSAKKSAHKKTRKTFA